MPFDYRRLSASVPASSIHSSPIVVAEIGTAHNGDLVKGLELVDAAAEAGADIAKVQVVFAQEILPPEAGLVPLPGGDTPLYEVFEKLERPVEFYAALAERTEERGIGFLASPFGERSTAILEQIGVGAWKVASPELNHEPLLELLARTGLPMILSTGMSMPADIVRALEVINGAAGNGIKPAITLLHCLTSYPAPEEEANLLVIPAMAKDYDCPVGLSDHSTDPVLIPALATALGAMLVEKHITLDRSAGGLDDMVALTPKAFSRMTAAMSRFANLPEPDRLSKAVDELAGEYGQNRVEAVLGDGIKGLADSEEAHYQRTNRSIHAVGFMKAGTVLDGENTALLRTEMVLDPGIEPRFRNEVYGRKLARDVKSGNGIVWDDLA